MFNFGTSVCSSEIVSSPNHSSLSENVICLANCRKGGGGGGEESNSFEVNHWVWGNTEGNGVSPPTVGTFFVENLVLNPFLVHHKV